jgi:hypothetical protein
VSLFNLRFRVVGFSAPGMTVCGIAGLWERPMVSVREIEREQEQTEAGEWTKEYVFPRWNEHVSVFDCDMSKSF